MSFEQIWAQADPDAVSQSGDNLEPPEDGVHVVCLVDADAFVSKNDRPFVKLQFQRTDDDYQWAVLLGFKSQQQANMTKRQVRNLGVDVEQVTDLGELAAAVKAHVGEFYAVTVSTSGQFRNTYVDGHYRQPAGDVPAEVPQQLVQAPAQSVSAIGGDDVPF